MRKLGWLGLAVAAMGCGSQDADCLGKLGVRLGEGARVLVLQWQERVRSQVPGIEESTLARVQQRLKNDKGLADATILVKAVDDGIELHGQAHSQEQRRRAIDLTEATLGVELVRDLIEVPIQRAPDLMPNE
jgi:hypothetical protein